MTGPDTWELISGGPGGTVADNYELRRDEHSIYLTNDKERGWIDIQLNLATGRITETHKPGGRAPVVFEHPVTGTFGTGSKPRPDIVMFAGTNQVITINGLRNRLKRRGLIKGNLVNSSTLDASTPARGECALIQPEADREDIRGEFALLTCAVNINDQVTFSVVALYAGCDVASVKEGIGSECEVGVAADEISIKVAEDRYQKLGVKVLTANECSGASSERICAELGASLASTTVEITDDSGNGLGFGLDVGFGVGGDAGYSEGVLHATVGLKFLVGGSVSISVDTRDPLKTIAFFGDVGYELVNGKVNSGTPSVAQVLSHDLGIDVGVFENRVTHGPRGHDRLGAELHILRIQRVLVHLAEPGNNF